MLSTSRVETFALSCKCSFSDILEEGLRKIGSTSSIQCDSSSCRRRARAVCQDAGISGEYFMQLVEGDGLIASLAHACETSRRRPMGGDHAIRMGRVQALPLQLQSKLRRR